MIEADSIRKSLFKGEIENIFKEYSVSSSQQDSLIYVLFEEEYSYSSSKQLLLRSDIKNSSALEKILRNAVTDKQTQLVGALISLFLIQDDLVIPPELNRSIINNEKVGVFVGAGISRLIGFPSWEELGDKAIEYLYRNNRINYFEYQRIQRDVVDPKQKMSIFHAVLPKNSESSKHFYKEIFSKPNTKKNNPYVNLAKIDWIKITSNIDNEFVNALDKYLTHPVIDIRDSMRKEDKVEERKRARGITSNFNVSDVPAESIFQIHGCIDELETSILTTDDYLKAYYEDDKGIKKFLEMLFEEYVIVFIGYGLSEFSILEHIIKRKKLQKHYALVGTYLNEMNVFGLMKKYFESIGVLPIPFYLDSIGYDRLITVLDSWFRQIEKGKEEKDRLYLDKIKEIDEVIG
jgi:hypothetical protein